MTTLEYEPAQPSTPPPDAPLAADYIDIDLSVGSTFERGLPHEAFDALRANAAVCWHEETTDQLNEGSEFMASPGFWAVTSHELVNEVSRDPQRFSSSIGGALLHSMTPEMLVMYRQMLLFMDGPEHARMRRILQPIFTPRAIGRLEAQIEQNVVDILDRAPVGEEFDFVKAVAAELPVVVLADLLGMPYEDRHLTFEWSNQLIGFEDPHFADDAGTLAVVDEVFAYGQAMADERRAHPRDDLVTLMATAEVDGERLSDIEFLLFWLMLIVAGNETTRNALTSSIRALAGQHLWADMKAIAEADYGQGGPASPMTLAVDELLRFATPIIHFRRTARTDTVLGGQQIRAGDKVVIWYPAANRDPAVFDRPHDLVLGRTPNPHLSFGIGPHFCLGSHLARLEMAAVMREMGRRYSFVEAGEPVHIRSNFVSGTRRQPVRLSA